MSHMSPHDRDRLNELLADRALWGLSNEESHELQRLIDRHPDVDLEVFDLTAADLHTALLGRSWEPMPDSVRSRVTAQAATWCATATVAGTVGHATRSTHPETANGPGTAHDHVASTSRDGSSWPSRRVATALAAGGWLAAAACLALLLMSPDGLQATRETTSPRAQRAALMESAPDLMQVAWTATDDPAALGTTGDVVWSTTRQEGYLRFVGLEVNDPTDAQYQLWIFDRDRPEETPVDGGVFDVTSYGEVVIPVKPKLTVSEPYLFAVTIEPPGGVVVSKRERIPVLADPTKPPPSTSSSSPCAQAEDGNA